MLRVMLMPEHASVDGDVFGGWAMAQVDIAGSCLRSSCSMARVRHLR